MADGEGAEDLTARVARLEQELEAERAAADALRQSATTMKATLDLTTASVFAKDLEGRYILVNPRGAEVVGMTPDQVLGRTDHELYDPVSAERFRQHDLEVMTSMAASIREVPVPTAEGELVYLSTLAPLVDESGRLYGVAGIAADVTERAQADALIRQRTRELITAQRIARLGSWSWDPTTGDVDISPELARMLSDDEDREWSADDLIALVHPEDRRVAAEAITGGATGIQPDVVIRIHDPDDEYEMRWLQLRTEIRHPGSPVIHGTIQDVTERERSQRERHQLETHLQQAQRLESVGRLAGGVAHDFNNLLAVIGIHADLARRQLDSGHLAQQHLVDLEETVERAASLTRQLMVFSRHEQVDRRPLDLSELIVSLSTLLRRSLGDDIELTLDLDEHLAAVVADRSQMEQVVVNLAVNARDAMPQGGRLTIRARNAPSEGATPEVHLEISDTGSGMPPEVLERAFEPFFTTKPPGSGTGLGLSTVHMIVTRSEGSLSIESAVGTGTTITVVLPASVQVAEPKPSEPVRAAVDPEPGGEKTVLVVEDLADLGKLTVAVLERAGYRTLLAVDGVEAVKIVEAAGPIDVLLTDVVMPNMSGGDLAARLRQDQPDLPVVFMSGYSAGMLEGRLPLDEQVHLLPKPFSRGQLLDMLETVLSIG